MCLTMATLRVRKRKDGSVYTSVLYRIDGKQSSVSFDLYDEAVWLRDLINRIGPAAALEIAYRRAGVSSTLTVAEWITHHVDHLTGTTARTRDDYRAILRNDIEPASIGALPLDALTADDVARWVNKMHADGASGKTIHNKHGFLAGALNAAVAAGKIPSNPCDGRRLPRTDEQEMVFLTREQFAKLRDSFTEHWRPLVEFLVTSGCRWGEAVALQPGDVNRDESTVRIWRAWRYRPGEGYTLGAPKTRKSKRTINVAPAVLDKLDYSQEWLFVNRDSGPVRSHGFIGRVWKPAVKRSGLVPPPRIHDLRHTCASWLIQAGTPLPVVQKHLGHESITTTVDRYGHTDRRDGADAAARIAVFLDR
jgi:integrase